MLNKAIDLLLQAPATIFAAVIVLGTLAVLIALGALEYALLTAL